MLRPLPQDSSTKDRTMLRCLTVAVLAVAIAQNAAAQAQPPLRCAVDATFAPHAMPKLGGGLEGFNIDLFQAIAKRLGRELVIEGGSFAGLIAALNAGRYDFLCAPTTATRERAENLLFTEGYLFTEYQFGIRRGSAPLRSLDDLRGKTIAVNKGSIYDTWARQNAERYGFTAQAYDSNTDAVQAVIAGRAYANLAGNTVIKFAATRNPLFVPDLVLKETRAHWSVPLRKDSVELRRQLEIAIECLKKDGTIAALSEKWFGVKPGPDDAENVVFPGFGPPGLPGYDPTPTNAGC